MPYRDDILPILGHDGCVLQNVAFVVLDRFPSFEFGVVCEVFGTDRTDDGLPAYDFAVVAGEDGPLHSEHGLTLAGAYGMERLAGADLVVISAIDEQLLASGQSELLLAQLHSQLLAAGVLPPRSRPSLLRGPLTTFAAARRTVYSPATPYKGKARLVLVDDPALEAEANLKQRETYVNGWRSRVSELNLWDGPGNHYSMLRRPQVDLLAKWWWDGLSTAAF